MKCTHCGKEIVLIPSANERAAKYGGTPEFYTRLFSMHNKCIMELRRKRGMNIKDAINTPLNESKRGMKK